MDNNMENVKIGPRRWLSFIMAGLVGQIAWALENMYLNAYAFYISGNITVITLMTALSAATATITTLFMGALSDKIGKRKAFIAFGYVIWGISIVIFAFLNPHNATMSIVGNSMMIAGTMIVIMDCVMTFFGSTANDAAFNAFVTDNTHPTNRGKVESFLSVLPMFSMILIVVIAGIFGADVNGGRWDIFFYIIGGITSIIGVALIFIIPKDTQKPDNSEPYFKNIFYGFRPSVIKTNPFLYITIIAFCVFSIAIQVFFPYLIVYIQKTLEIVDTNFIITFGVVLVVSSLVTICLGLFMDKIGKNKIIIPAVSVTALGTLLFFFAKDMVFVIIAATILMSGYMVSVAVFGAKIRDYTPAGKAGLFQGIRMIGMVLIPMVTGPYIGRGLSEINAQYYTNEFNQPTLLPNKYIFLGTLAVLLLTLVPVIILLRKEKQHVEDKPE